MQIEYSKRSREGFDYAYTFDKWEMQTIAKALKSQIKVRERKIERIANHPKNEGQATFSFQIDNLRLEIKLLQEIIDDFSK